MNEQDTSRTNDRSAAKGRILGKLYRYRKLLVSLWWVLLVCAIVGAGVAVGLFHLQQPTYSSYGRMIVSMKLSLPEGSAYTEEMSNFLGTQSALMQSGVVVNRAHTRVIEQKPEFQFEQAKVKVTVLPRTTIFVLRATSANPAYAPLFLQGCMDEYTNLKREMRSQTSDVTVGGLTDEVLRVKKELAKAEDDLVSFQTTNSVVLLQEQGNSAGNYLLLLTQRLAALRSEFELLQTLTLEQNLERARDPGTRVPTADDVLTRTARFGTDPVELTICEQSSK